MKNKCTKCGAALNAKAQCVKCKPDHYYHEPQTYVEADAVETAMDIASILGGGFDGGGGFGGGGGHFGGGGASGDW